MNAEHNVKDGNHVSNIVDALSSVNWRRVAKYGVSAGIGATTVGIAGNEFGRDIADLLVESKMGMEKAILGHYIAKASPYIGVIVGTAIAYMHDRFNKKASTND